MRFRLRAPEVTASLWNAVADHPRVGPFIHRYIDSTATCFHCKNVMWKHGWIDSVGGRDRTVCPGDYVVTDENGYDYPCKPAVFTAKYEEVERE